jgi:hypothetical protein
MNQEIGRVEDLLAIGQVKQICHRTVLTAAGIIFVLTQGLQEAILPLIPRPVALGVLLEIGSSELLKDCAQ